MSGAKTGFRRRSRLLSAGAAGAFALIAALMLGLVAVCAPHLGALGPRRLWLLALIAAPIVFYLWALWNVRRLFVGLAERGLVFDRTSGAAVARTGWGLFLGGAVTLAAAPLVLTVANPQSASGFAVAGLPALTLCLVGLALVTLTSLIKQGVVIQTEREALQSTLDEFVQVPVRVTLDAVLKARGVQAKTVAETIGISETQLSLFRSGKVRGLRFSTLSKLCLILQCQPGDLIRYDADDRDIYSTDQRPLNDG